MTYIKRMTMHGFKSFANKTEVLFDSGMNVVVGPNGSGKSNVSDALCFVLGRLSIKSMRAAKAKNLIFMGSKSKKPAAEASVEVAFCNETNTFQMPGKEITLKRIVRRNGQSIYKINGQTKTRGDVVEVLAQAGIDPHGFNLVLQGQIQAIVKMHPDERRKIIEEVAGIAIYESRKEKSLKELAKTDERLKEVSTVLRERVGFLKNLERERAQALKFKELEKTITRCKASIINRKIEDKTKELESIHKSISDKTKQKDEMKAKADKVESQIAGLNEKIEQINKHIQKATGTEQETLRNSIANLRAELEGLRVRKENFENRNSEIEKRVNQIKKSIPECEAEIEALRKESPEVAKKQAELSKKKQELAKLEEERKKVYALKSELQGVRDRLRDKESQAIRASSESDSALKQIESYTLDFVYDGYELCKTAIEKFREDISKHKEKLNEFSKSEVKSIKEISTAEAKIQNAEEIKNNIADIDVCPLCQNKMTEEHLSHVNSDCSSKIKEANKIISDSNKSLESIKSERENLNAILHELETKSRAAERELSNHSLVKDRQDRLKALVEQENTLKKEIKELQTRRESLEKRTVDSSSIDERYSTTMREIEEISSRTEKDLDTTLLYKERELENMRDIIKRSSSDSKEVSAEVAQITELIKSKKELLSKKEGEEQEMSKRFKKMFEDRDAIQKQIQEENYNHTTLQHQWRQVEDQINYLKVGNAKIDAEKEALEMEFSEFPNIELIKATVSVLQERLNKAQATIQTIGSINMRALEVYDEVKAEYDRVQEKVDTLEKEKTDILKIIDEIDAKKKRTFMKTFRGVNDLFIRNFSQLSRKGQAYLEIENKQDIFAGGVSIVIKMAKGKYFDVTSLSGGEQTLIALSLLFAIQEHKPYHFYFFDEIDAALDKRNSERLSALLKKYKQKGQYLVVTHNDAIILDSNVLYGVSMHDGISKVLSINLDEKESATKAPPKMENRITTADNSEE